MKTKILLILFGLLASFTGFAQEPVAASSGLAKELIWVIYIVVGLMLILALFLWKVSIHLRKFMTGQFETEEHKMYDSRSTWEKIFQLKPIGTDKDSMMGHSYDGIQELDNPPPPWFMFLFYGSVLFAVIYFVRFSVTNSGPTQEQEYQAELAAMEISKAKFISEQDLSIDETNVALLTDEEELNEGSKIYIKNCKTCHSDAGKGSTGPNLTDEYWKHGGGIVNVFKTIKYGYVEKGMAAWKDNLTPKQIQQVGSYIISLQGTNPPGGLPPEGEKWIPEEKTVESDTTKTDSTAQQML